MILEPRKLFETVMAILSKYGVMKIAVFGSYARGDAREDSDIDLLVEVPEGTTIFDLVGMEQDLSEATGHKIDLLTKGSISPYLIDRIKKDLVLLT